MHRRYVSIALSHQYHFHWYPPFLSHPPSPSTLTTTPPHLHTTPASYPLLPGNPAQGASPPTSEAHGFLISQSPAESPSRCLHLWATPPLQRLPFSERWKKFKSWVIRLGRALWEPTKQYRKTSNISRTLICNTIVDSSDVVGASPVGAAPTTSSFST